MANNRVISMSYGCKTPDGRHIYGENRRCLMCWQTERTSDRASKVVVILISADASERECVDRLAEIIEGQVRGVLRAVVLTQDENRRLNLPGKTVDLQVCAS